MRAALTGLVVSVALHAGLGGLGFVLLRTAPDLKEAEPEPTELRMAVMEVPTRDAEATPPDAPRAEAAASGAARAGDRAVPSREGRAVAAAGAATPAASVEGAVRPQVSAPAERAPSTDARGPSVAEVGAGGAAIGAVPPRARTGDAVAPAVRLAPGAEIAGESLPSVAAAPERGTAVEGTVARVAPVRAGGAQVGAVAPASRPGAVARAQAQAALLSLPRSERAIPVSAPATRAAAAQAQSDRAVQPESPTARLPARVASARRAEASPDPARPAPAARPEAPGLSDRAGASAVGAEAVASSAPDAPSLDPEPESLAPGTPEAPAAAFADPAEGARRLTAALDWSAAGALQLDEDGLTALRAFLQPEAAAGRAVRDGMTDALAAPDCARLRTVFDPETGALLLRGHVPDEQSAAPLIAALRAEIGDTLPLRDELRVLPDPQCGLLDGLDRIGLPQSEDQLTNPNVVGEQAHVREYDFAAGDRLVLDLTTPDYPAHLYVDYFDSEGQVLHLTPNSVLPLAEYPPATLVTLGRDDALELRIAPPFGQDIVVALAASRPLYEGLRPVREPASDYLSWLRERVGAMRAAHSDFRGEWVYLFVATAAASE